MKDSLSASPGKHVKQRTPYVLMLLGMSIRHKPQVPKIIEPEGSHEDFSGTVTTTIERNDKIQTEPIPIYITLAQMDEYAIENGRQTHESYDRVEKFIRSMEKVPPVELLSRFRPLILDEGICPDDLILWVLDEDTGEQYRCALRLMDIFGLVWKPVVQEKVDFPPENTSAWYVIGYAVGRLAANIRDSFKGAIHTGE